MSGMQVAVLLSVLAISLAAPQNRMFNSGLSMTHNPSIHGDVLKGHGSVDVFSNPRGHLGLSGNYDRVMSGPLKGMHEGSVGANGRYDVLRSSDGMKSLGVNGDYSRTIIGPNRGMESGRVGLEGKYDFIRPNKDGLSAGVKGYYNVDVLGPSRGHQDYGVMATIKKDF